jgi:transposase
MVPIGKEAKMNVLPHDRVDELQRLYRTETNARLARRIQAVWLGRQGRTCRQIMDVTGAGRRTVFDWVAKYNDGGIDALLDRPRSGRPTLLSETQQQQLAERLEAGPRPEDSVCVFHAATVERIVEKEFGVLYSLRAIQVLLRRLGFSYQAPRPRHETSDPVVQEAFKKTSQSGWRRSPPSIPASASRSTSRTKRGSASTAR